MFTVYSNLNNIILATANFEASLNHRDLPTLSTTARENGIRLLPSSAKIIFLSEIRTDKIPSKRS